MSRPMQLKKEIQSQLRHENLNFIFPCLKDNLPKFIKSLRDIFYKKVLF